MSKPSPTGLCMAWHTHQQRLAVVDASDSVQLYDLTPCARPVTTANDLQPPPPGATLHHGGQAGVAALAFRPHGAGLLAVGGRSGVRLWDLEANTSRSGTHLIAFSTDSSLDDISWLGGRVKGGKHTLRCSSTSRQRDSLLAKTTHLTVPMLSVKVYCIAHLPQPRPQKCPAGRL